MSDAVEHLMVELTRQSRIGVDLIAENKRLLKRLSAMTAALAEIRDATHKTALMLRAMADDALQRDLIKQCELPRREE